MPSPFPGMDPYLEGDLWMTVHTDLCAEIARQLAPKLRPRYVALSTRRVVIAPPDESEWPGGQRFPDVGILSSTRTSSASGASAVARAPLVGKRLRANLIWLGKEPFTQGRDYKLKLHTAAVPVRIARVNKVIDASEAGKELRKDHVGRHDVADLVLETKDPVAFDLIGDAETSARFVIVDRYEISGGGIIVGREEDEQDALREEARLRDFHWVNGGVTRAERDRRHGHRPALVMFVGPADADKHRYARAVEKALFASGHNAYMLDGSNVLLGVDADLHFVDATQRELVRRFSEVAHLLLDAGTLVISTTNAIGLADYEDVQALLPDTESVVVDIDPKATSAADCDLRIRGNEPEAEVVAKVAELLARRQITRA